MKIEGYKLSGYDATYRKALFNVNERGNRVLEVTDVDSGITFLLDFESVENSQKIKTRTWKKREQRQEKHGISISVSK